ncbi:MAG: DUF2335 domain-containing protein [Pseudomonadota bacterium]|nr:DUF2335 domain-containing protein [Pseudomonadota bacterium]
MSQDKNGKSLDQPEETARSADIATDLAEVEAAVQQGDAQAAIVAALRLVRTSGPLPSPEAVEGYERILPGAAERLFAMAEKQAEHRRALESQSLAEEFKLQNRLLDLKARGQWFAVAAVLAGAALAAFALYSGHPAAAATIFGVGLAPVVGAFLYVRKEAQAFEKTETEEDSSKTR